MADEAPISEKAPDIETKIKSAMLSRASYFIQQANTLTFEGVRRVLEKDLGLETNSLDAHKRFVKQWLQTCIESASADKLPKSQDDAGENAVSSTDGEAEPLDELQTKKEAEELNSGDGDKLEDSPVMGLMTRPKKVENDTDGAEDTKNKAVPSETTIKKAVLERASYIRENSQTITMGGLRRLLEEDLDLEKHTLDPFKKFINQQVEEVLESPEISQATVSDKKKSLKKKDARGRVSSKSSKEETPTSSANDSDEVEEDEVKVRKRSAAKRKPQKSEAVKKRKRGEDDTKGARKQSKVSRATSKGSTEEDGGDVSEDGDSDVSAEKTVKKKEIPKPSHGKEVERLKSVIKSCGLSIPPAIYKRVRQAPENKREACLIEELEGILAKEGLSTNPSEKEIKDVKKRKERAKELEGIDLSNIVSSSRRRSTASFVPPPKPKISDESESESEDSENEDEEDDNEDEEDEEVAGEEEEEVGEDQENGGDDSQSEKSEEDDGDSD